MRQLADVGPMGFEIRNDIGPMDFERYRFGSFQQVDIIEHMEVDDITQGRYSKVFLKLRGQMNYSGDLIKFRILSTNSRVSY